MSNAAPLPSLASLFQAAAPVPIGRGGNAAPFPWMSALFAAVTPEVLDPADIVIARGRTTAAKANPHNRWLIRR